MRSLIAVVLFIYVADCKHFRSDYNFHSEAKGWLKLHQIPTTFRDAWFRCNLEGAVLASPSNALIEAAMRKEMRHRPITMDGVFTGIHATFSKGDFFSIEGVPLNNMQLQWMPSEPDNKNNDEQCILYNENKTIADIRCSETHPYICYKESSPNMFLTGCGTIDPEYKLESQTGKCYKFHTAKRNWTLAFMTCAAEGGHLAVVNSQTEATALKNLIAPHGQTETFIGFYDWNEMGVWTTIHGTSLVDAGFATWSSGEPNNKPPGEHCGSMQSNGLLNDVSCLSILFFICEKSPESLQNY